MWVEITELMKCIRDNKWEEFLLLLNQKPKTIGEIFATKKEKKSGYTILHYACFYGRSEMAEQILLKDPRLLYAKDNNQETPLAIAIKQNQVSLILYLINKGLVHPGKGIDLPVSIFLCTLKLYLYTDQHGNFFLGSEEDMTHNKLEKMGIADISGFEKELIYSEELLLMLIDKYLYKKVRHKKYDRDIALGKNDDYTIRKNYKSKRNLIILKTAISLLHPSLPSLSHKLDQFTLQDHLEMVDDKILNQFLTHSQQIHKKYYGDDLSDDSDEEDEQDFATAPRCKIKRLRDTFNLQAGIPDFWDRVGQNVSIDLKHLVLLHQDKKITSEQLSTGLTKSEAEFKLALQARATIYTPLDDTQKKDLETINGIILKQGKICPEDLGKLGTQFFIAQYRGINYMLDRWSADARRYHRTLNEERLPQYSELVLKTLPYCFYTELSAENDFTKIGSHILLLFAHALQLKEFFQQLEQSGPCLDYTDESKKKAYLFNNIADRFQHRFSNGIDSHLAQLQHLRRTHAYWAKQLPSAHNPALATGDRPYHALRYTYGLKKYYPYRFSPRYHGDGKLEYFHAGKVYVSMHSLEEVIGPYKPNRVSEMNKRGQVVIADLIAPERETSFLSFIESDTVFHHFIAKYPSFHGAYKNIYRIKYGLTLELYQSFQYLIQHSEIASPLREQIINLLSEWLCAYYEVLLIEISKQEAQRRGGVLVYLNHDGQLSLKPDKGRLFNRGDGQLPTRNAVLIRREVRKELAERIKGDIKTQKNKTSYPGFSVVKTEEVNTNLQSFYRSPSATKYSKLFSTVKLTSSQKSALPKKGGANAEKPAKKVIIEKELEYQLRSLFFSTRLFEKDSIIPPVTISHPQHLYTDNEINTLLRSYFRNGPNDFVARTLNAQHPLIKGPHSEEAKQNFIDDLKLAFNPGVPSVLPINLTNEWVDNNAYSHIFGIHWVGLVIRPMGGNNYHIDYIDPQVSPDHDLDISVEEINSIKLQQGPAIANIVELIRSAAGQSNVHISLNLLHTEQQAGDLDCGAWTVDNLRRRARNQSLRTNQAISGQQLRTEHNNTYRAEAGNQMSAPLLSLPSSGYKK